MAMFRANSVKLAKFFLFLYILSAESGVIPSIDDISSGARAACHPALQASSDGRTSCGLHPVSDQKAAADMCSGSRFADSSRLAVVVSDTGTETRGSGGTVLPATSCKLPDGPVLQPGSAFPLLYFLGRSGIHPGADPLSRNLKSCGSENGSACRRK